MVVAGVAVHLTEDGVATHVGDVGEEGVVVAGPVALVH